MKYTEYLEVDILEEIAKSTPPAELHTFLKTKVHCDTFSGLSIHGCPGKTGICSSKCYDARSLKYLVGGMANVRKALHYTYWAMYHPEILLQQLIKEVYTCTDVIRVHVGGDFVSGIHVQVWQEVAACYPEKRFFAYTRSWTVPAINKELLVLKELPNFTVFASVDAQTGLPPADEEWRIAQMTHYFQNVPRTIQCPEQTGRLANCQTCRLCFGDKRVKTNLFFALHGSGMKVDNTLIINKDNQLFRR